MIIFVRQGNISRIRRPLSLTNLKGVPPVLHQRRGDDKKIYLAPRSYSLVTSLDELPVKGKRRMTQTGRKVLVFRMSPEDLMQVVPMESNNSLVANLPDSGCVTHPVQNYLSNSCLTNLVMLKRKWLYFLLHIGILQNFFKFIKNLLYKSKKKILLIIFKFSLRNFIRKINHYYV